MRQKNRTDSFLAGLLVLSAVYILAYEYWLVNIPEIFWKASRLGIMIEQLSLAYIVSYIFYRIVIIVKRKRDEKYISTYIDKKTNRIIDISKALFNRLFRKSGINEEPKWPPDMSTIKQICDAIGPSDKSTLLKYSPSRTRRAPWAEYFAQHIDIIDRNIDQIYSYMPYLDTEYVNLIGKIEECKLFEKIRYRQLTGVPMKNYAFIAESLHEYFGLICDLESYSEP